MATEIQRQKYEMIFKNLDADDDGDIDQTDIDALIQSWTLLFDAAPGSSEWERIAKLGNRWWQNLIGTVDSDGDKVVTKEEWFRSFEQPDFIDNVAIPFGLAAFDLGDKDGDGKINREEYVRGAIAGRATAAESFHAFSLLDEDGDGYITREEARKYLEEFYKGTDPDSVVNYVK
jgi:Ca2+-binding EF-hand superfamily protein